MATVFEVQSQDITELNDLNLTKLLKMLLHLEAKSAGIAERAVDVALNIRAADGGEDGRVEWNDGPDSTNFLPSRLVQFQNKATNMRPADCAKEIIGTDGNLKAMVEQALDNGGSYIIFTTQELNNQQKQARIDAIREKLNEQGKPYANTAIIEIYDATKIQGWVNHYVAAIIAVLNWIGRPLVNGLYTWDEWEQFDENHLFEYVADETRNEAIDGLRTLLIQPKKCARVIGLSGLGKTRLALEICRGHDEEDGFRRRVVYIDAEYSEPNLPGLVSSWVKLGLDCLVVVDNCDLALHKQIRREIEYPDSTMSLLSLHYSPEKDSDTDPIQLSTMSDDLIKSMLGSVYGDKITDLDRIVSFAQGFPLMAVLLTKARLDQTRDMGSITDDILIEKMLWGGAEQDEEAKAILQACSLFDKFGIEKEMEVESKFIAENIAGTDEDALYKCIKAFEERGVINRAGRFAQIIPKPLAIRLAADWWRSTRPQRQQELIEMAMPGQLERSFCEQISKLDFLPQVKDLTENLCGDQGPFGKAEVILSDRGSRLFRSLVEVNPKATSEALYRILSPYSADQFKDISGDVRRNLVWALEKLCFHEIAFEKSAKCLMWLAAAENETWANNATGQFLQLFRTFLSGTEAPPEKRLVLLDEAIKQDHMAIRELAVNALESVINTHSGSRTVGAEYQGSGEPLEEWRPKIWQDAFDYWIAALERLTSIALENGEVSQLAKDAIASHIRGLVQRSRDVMHVLDSSIKQIVTTQGPLWRKALESIKSAISYDAEKMPDEAKQMLNEWVELLTPTRLEERIELIVSKPPYEHKKDKDGHYIDIAAINSERFAQELSDDIGGLIPYITQLMSGDQRQGVWFGRNLVLSSKQWEPLLSETIALISSIENPNINFLLGLLGGIYQLDKGEWNTYIAQFKDSKELNKYYPDVIRTGLIEKEQLDNIIELIESGRIEESSASVFTFGRALDHLDPEIVIQFVDHLRKISNKAAWIGLDILSMYCYGDKDKWESCEVAFKEMLIDLPLERESKRQQLEVHHWKEAAEKILNNNDADFAKKLTERILLSCNDKIDYGDFYHYIKPVMRLLLNNYGKYVWLPVSDAIKNANPMKEHYLSQLFSKEDNFSKKQTSVLADLPEEILYEWCRENVDIAPLFVAHSTDVYIEENEEYKISPRAKFLIDEFGDNKKVLSAISANMGSFGWSGSVVPIFKKEVVALEPLLKHKLQTVREWAESRISYLNKSIEKAAMHDEEMDWGIR